jgi:uncharacterized protein involved in response to NO
MALAILWIAGRVLVVTPFQLLAATVNAAFAVAVAVSIAVPLFRAANRRNYFLVALLGVIAAAELTLHLSYFGVLAWPLRLSLQVGLDIVLLIMVVMGGRVIPMFTNNGVAGASARRNPLLEKWCLAGALALVLADVAQLSAPRRAPRTARAGCRATRSRRAGHARTHNNITAAPYSQVEIGRVESRGSSMT